MVTSSPFDALIGVSAERLAPAAHAVRALAPAEVLLDPLRGAAERVDQNRLLGRVVVRRVEQPDDLVTHEPVGLRVLGVGVLLRGRHQYSHPRNVGMPCPAAICTAASAASCSVGPEVTTW